MVNNSEGPANARIYEAICGVMEDIGAVGKNDVNKQQGFKYRSIDAVMNALSPAMIKHKVFCVPELLEQSREERQSAKGTKLIYSICRMRYRFYTTDGSYVEAVTVGEGMDSGDKATNKAMAIAFKYACFQTFCIPTEELMDDPDRDSPETGKKKRASGKAQQEAGTGKKEPGNGRAQTSGTQQEEKRPGNAGGTPAGVNAAMIQTIRKELNRTGKAERTILAAYGLKHIEEMTVEQYKNCMKRFEMTPDKAEKGQTA